MSKLGKRLRQVLDDSVQPLGFRTATQSTGRPMVVIACLTGPDVGVVGRIAGTGIDGIVVREQGGSQSKTLKGLAGSAGATPWGIWGDAATEELVQGVKEAGGDFVVIEAATASAALLQEEELAKLLLADLPSEEKLAGAISDLPVDAVLMRVKSEGTSLTISEVIRCQWLAGLVNKPVLVFATEELSGKDVPSLWEAGAKGVVLQLPPERLEDGLARLLQVVESLPSHARRRAGRRVVIPRLSYDTEEGD